LLEAKNRKNNLLPSFISTCDDGTDTAEFLFLPQLSKDIKSNKKMIKTNFSIRIRT
jgi:hypothetical protein